MDESLEREIRDLRQLFRSERDPEGRVFAPLADAYRRAGRHETAVELLREGLGRHPEFATGHVVAGWVHRDRGAPAEAEASFRRVLELDDENVRALTGLARLVEEKGDATEAAALYGRARELGWTEPAVREAKRPGGSETLASRVERVEKVDGPEREDAVVDERDGAPGEPSSRPEGPMTRTMAEVYVRQGLVDRAIEVYERLLERNPDDAELRGRLDELRDEVTKPEETDSMATETSGAGTRPISEYFEALLAWDGEEEETEAEPVSEVETPVEVEAVAEPEPVAELEVESGPDEVEVVEEAALEIGELAPEAPEAEVGEEAALDVGALAPEEAEEDEATLLDVGALAPDDPDAALDVGALAPDAADEAVMEVGALAPESGDEPVMDVGALAPEDEDAGVMEVGALAPEAGDEVADIGAFAPDSGEADDREEALDIGALAPDEEG